MARAAAFGWATDGARDYRQGWRRASANARPSQYGRNALSRLDGKIAIVTGAGQGIGEGIARKFAAEGARVIVAERDRKTGAAVAASLPGARFIHTDVAKEDSIVAMVAETVATVGPPDILVNNAGIAVFDEPLKPLRRGVAPLLLGRPRRRLVLLQARPAASCSTRAPAQSSTSPPSTPSRSSRTPSPTRSPSTACSG